jgi:hypothetical protein
VKDFLLELRATDKVKKRPEREREREINGQTTNKERSLLLLRNPIKYLSCVCTFFLVSEISV